MKPPTEADLIELENTALRHYREIVDEQNGLFTKYDRAVSTLEYLIARARYHNTQQSQRAQASTAPKPSVVVQPKKEAHSKAKDQHSPLAYAYSLVQLRVN